MAKQIFNLQLRKEEVALLREHYIEQLKQLNARKQEIVALLNEISKQEQQPQLFETLLQDDEVIHKPAPAAHIRIIDNSKKKRKVPTGDNRRKGVSAEVIAIINEAKKPLLANEVNTIYLNRHNITVRKKGFNKSMSSIAAALKHLVDKNELERVKDNGNFIYSPKKQHHHGNGNK